MQPLYERGDDRHINPRNTIIMTFAACCRWDQHIQRVPPSLGHTEGVESAAKMSAPDVVNSESISALVSVFASCERS